MRPELIIFDCDGVLVDSEPIANRIMAEAVTALGWPLSAADCIARFKGHHLDTVIAAVEARLGRPVPEDWVANLRAATGAAFERELQPVPGVVEALDAASQGPPEKMAVSLGVTGLRARFDCRIFSAYQVERGKPHPDLFLFAAETMGVALPACSGSAETAAGLGSGRADPKKCVPAVENRARMAPKSQVRSIRISCRKFWEMCA